jgi:hypothetical protein
MFGVQFFSILNQHNLFVIQLAKSASWHPSLVASFTPWILLVAHPQAAAPWILLVSHLMVPVAKFQSLV